ncbi:phage portal protein [Alteriqipengyuania sp.]|uniref:phage portal protein n=1 Tax=Alteriqipengyuania sp. TaxID=2800692 RepID=UPI0035164121
MGFLRRLFSLEAAAAHAAPRAMTGELITISGPEDLERALRHGNMSNAGQAVTDDTAMRVAAVYACVRIISGAVANMPIGIKRRIDDRTRVDVTDHSLWEVFHRRPNRWQKPAQFKRMMQAHVLLRGNGYALKTRGVGGRVIGLTPLHPGRMKERQRDDMALEYLFTRKDGSRVLFQQDEILHLCGLTLNGYSGLSVIGYAREAIGASIAMEHHGSTVFRNGANVSGALKMPAGKTLTEEQAARLKGEFDEFRAGGNREGKVVLLEDGLEFQQLALNSEDAQWLEARKFSRSDIAMFFGVPPHMIGDTEKSTSWGSGIEAQAQGFVTYTLEDHLTMWEEALTTDCLDPVRDRDVYARFNRNALVRGDLKTRWEGHTKALQWGVMSPDEVRAKEDMNPREDGNGGVYYDPPNTAGSSTGSTNDNP